MLFLYKIGDNKNYIHYSIFQYQYFQDNSSNLNLQLQICGVIARAVLFRRLIATVNLFNNISNVARRMAVLFAPYVHNVKDRFSTIAF